MVRLKKIGRGLAIAAASYVVSLLFYFVWTISLGLASLAVNSLHTSWRVNFLGNPPGPSDAWTVVPMTFLLSLGYLLNQANCDFYRRKAMEMLRISNYGSNNFYGLIQESDAKRMLRMKAENLLRLSSESAQARAKADNGQDPEFQKAEALFQFAFNEFGNMVKLIRANVGIPLDDLKTWKDALEY